MPVPLGDEEYRLFSDWLSAELGIRFGPDRREILRFRLEPRRAELGLSTFHQLYFHLRFHPEREAELQRLIPYLTNNESYFFREKGALEIFRDELLPRLRRELPAAGRRELRVLSAGCSAGQEPYSLAILLRDGRAAAPLRPRITAVDVDPIVLERARSGRFTAHSFRGVDDAFRDRYFQQRDTNEWEISRPIRDAVDFRTANLADPEWPAGLPCQDVVFCRNVLIYFDEAALRRAARGLHDVLTPGGYLFLGHAESLSRVPTPLQAERRPGAVFYRRPVEET